MLILIFGSFLLLQCFVFSKFLYSNIMKSYAPILHLQILPILLHLFHLLLHKYLSVQNKTKIPNPITIGEVLNKLWFNPTKKY